MKIKNSLALFALLKEEFGYRGENKKDAVAAYIKENGIILEGTDGKAIDLDALFKKTVNIEVSADAGEDVQISQPDAAEEAAEEATGPAEPKATVEAAPKNAKVSAVRKAASSLGSFKIASNTARKAYNVKAALGQTYYADADEAEYYGALFRYLAIKPNESNGNAWHYDPATKALDLDIIRNKTGVTNVNELGGNLIIGEASNSLIVNKNSYGVVRKLVGVTPMREGQWFGKSINDEVAMTVNGEAVSITETNTATPTFGKPSLYAKAIKGIAKISSELLNDSPINIADAFRASFDRIFGYWEDDLYFNGNAGVGIQGLKDAIGSASTSTTAGATWGSITDAELLTAQGLVQDWAENVPGTMAWTCTKAFYQSVFARLMRASGGVTLMEAGNGQSTPSYNGLPIIINQRMAKVSAAATISAYVGNFSASTKFGEVKGSRKVDTSDQRYWDEDVIGIRGVERIAQCFHDVGDSTYSGGVVALKTHA